MPTIPPPLLHLPIVASEQPLLKLARTVLFPQHDKILHHNTVPHTHSQTLYDEMACLWNVLSGRKSNNLLWIYGKRGRFTRFPPSPSLHIAHIVCSEHPSPLLCLWPSESGRYLCNLNPKPCLSPNITTLITTYTSRANRPVLLVTSAGYSDNNKSTLTNSRTNATSNSIREHKQRRSDTRTQNTHIHTPSFQIKHTS